MKSPRDWDVSMAIHETLIKMNKMLIFLIFIYKTHTKCFPQFLSDKMSMLQWHIKVLSQGNVWENTENRWGKCKAVHLGRNYSISGY